MKRKTPMRTIAIIHIDGKTEIEIDTTGQTDNEALKAIADKLYQIINL